MTTPQLADFFVTATNGRWYNRLFAGAIRLLTASRVNHAGLYVGPTSDYPEGAIIEASRRVQYNSVNAYPDAIWSTGRLPANLTPTDAQRSAIVAAAVTMIDDKYNFVDIGVIAFAQRRLGGWMKSRDWVAKRVNALHREICSQLVDRAYLRGGVHLFNDNRLEGLVSPQDLRGLIL